MKIGKKVLEAINDARIKRPLWYKKYHASGFSDLIHGFILSVAIFFLLIGFLKILLPVSAETGVETTITQSIYPNKLGVSAPLYLYFSPIVSNIFSWQNSTSILDNIILSNTRNGETSWTVSVICSGFSAINQPVKLHGLNDTLTSGGEYTNPKGGIYTITITKGGNTGIAQFNVKGMEDQNGTTGTNVLIGTRGLTATFAPAKYVTGDSWEIRVDTIPVSNLTVTPRGLTLLSGKSVNAHLGPSHTFLNRNDPATILVVPLGLFGNSYSTSLFLSLRIPPFTYANKYRAVLSITSE